MDTGTGDANSTIESNPAPITDLLSLLTEAAKVVNPIQFQLPPNYTPSISFPGSSKRAPNHHTHHHHPSSSRSKKQPHELDNGLVPLPVKTCFKCVRSCRKAPLIQCDYCPLLYHADCLSPPLTTLPTTRWMCPNHVEPHLEEKLLQSANISERMNLWKKCRTKISDEDIKVNFLRKIHHKSVPYRANPKDGPVNCVRVPQSIKYLYDNPPEISQPDPSVTSDNNLGLNLKEDIKTEALGKIPDELEWRISRMCRKELFALKSMMDLQSGSNNQLPSQQLARCEDGQNEQDDDQDSQRTDSASESQPLNDDPYQATSGLGDSIGCGSYMRNDEFFSDLVSSNERLAAKTKNSSSLIAPCDSGKLNSLIDRNDPVSRINPLGWCKFDNKTLKNEKCQEMNSTGVFTNHVSSSCDENTPITDKGLKIRARAVLFPVQPKIRNGNRDKMFSKPDTPLIPMFHRTLSIGLGVNNDVNLVKFGTCNYLSLNHACIFYDEVS